MSITYGWDMQGHQPGIGIAKLKTNWQFGGDGMWNPNSKFTYHLARFRDGACFIRYDSFEADPTSPASLHKYLYCSSDPVRAWDPSGNEGLVSTLVTAGIQSGLMSMLLMSPVRAYQAARDLYNGATIWETLVNLGERELVDFGAGFAGGVLFRGASLAISMSKVLQQGVAFTFSKLSFASTVLREGTQIPKFFQWATEAGPVFVKDSDTKHFTNIVTNAVKESIKNGVSEASSAGLTRSASAMILESLESAVVKALQNPTALPLGTPIMSEGWELIFTRSLVNPVMRELIHAVPKAI